MNNQCNNLSGGCTSNKAVNEKEGKVEKSKLSPPRAPVRYHYVDLNPVSHRCVLSSSHFPSLITFPTSISPSLLSRQYRLFPDGMFHFPPLLDLISRLYDHVGPHPPLRSLSTSFPLSVSFFVPSHFYDVLCRFGLASFQFIRPSLL